MPMIDVYASEGTFSDTRKLAQELASAVMRWEQVPNLALFRDNTVAFIHEMPATAISTVAGRSDYIRVQVLTPVGALDRDKQLGVVKELTEIVAAAAAEAHHHRSHMCPHYRVPRGRLGPRRSRQHGCRHCRSGPSRVVGALDPRS